jgi:hypothetical protein
MFVATLRRTGVLFHSQDAGFALSGGIATA